MGLFQKEQITPGGLADTPKVTVGGDFGRTSWFLGVRAKLGLASNRAFLLACLAGGFILIAGVVLLVMWSRPAPSVSPKSPTTSPVSENAPGAASKDPDNPAAPAAQTDTDSNDQTPTSPASGGGTSSGGTGSSTGGTSGGTSGGSSGGGTSNPCSGAANHVAGGADGTGTCWPGPSNTGVPAGTTLTAYTGSCSITTANTVINAKTVNCSLDIHAANVVIKNSKINGSVILDPDLSGSSAWSFTLQDSEVDAGQDQTAAVGWGNMTVIRSNIYGGITSVQCEEKSVSCTLQDSYLHGQYIPDNANWHLGGFLSDGGQNMTITHNYIVCDHAVNSVGEGCTGDLNLIPNFAAINGALIQHNLFGANIGSAYCTYGGEKSTSATPNSYNVKYKDNIFQRGSNGNCAAYGPVTNFEISNTGNEWTNNRWDNGGIVDPVN